METRTLVRLGSETVCRIVGGTATKVTGCLPRPPPGLSHAPPGTPVFGATVWALGAPFFCRQINPLLRKLNPVIWKPVCSTGEPLPNTDVLRILGNRMPCSGVDRPDTAPGVMAGTCLLKEEQGGCNVGPRMSDRHRAVRPSPVRRSGSRGRDDHTTSRQSTDSSPALPYRPGQIPIPHFLCGYMETIPLDPTTRTRRCEFLTSQSTVFTRLTPTPSPHGAHRKNPRSQY